MFVSPVYSSENPPAFRPGLPAAQVDQQLQSAVQHWQNAEHNVVLWYAELHRRRLFKELGFGSIHLYAAERLGFSQARSYQFLKLAERLQALPKLEKSVAAGEVGWTKARAVARVATPKSEERWVEQAKNSSRRELEEQIDQTRRRTKAVRAKDRDQLDLTSVATSPCGSGGVESRDQSSDPSETGRLDHPIQAHGLQKSGIEEEAVDLPVSVTVQFDSTQLARHESLMAKLRHRGRREEKAELLLAALEALLVADATSELTRTVEAHSTPAETDGAERVLGNGPRGQDTDQLRTTDHYRSGLSDSHPDVSRV